MSTGTKKRKARNPGTVGGLGVSSKSRAGQGQNGSVLDPSVKTEVPYFKELCPISIYFISVAPFRPPAYADSPSSTREAGKKAMVLPGARPQRRLSKTLKQPSGLEVFARKEIKWFHDSPGVCQAEADLCGSAFESLSAFIGCLECYRSAR